METEKPKSIFQCEMCSKQIGGGGSKNMYILGCFHPGKNSELKFCSMECINDFLDVNDEFENEEEETQEEENE